MDPYGLSRRRFLQVRWGNGDGCSSRGLRIRGTVSSADSCAGGAGAISDIHRADAQTLR